MKIKNINLNISDDKAVLLGALGLIVYNAVNVGGSAAAGVPVMYEVDADGNPIAETKQNSNYIGMITKALSANDYSAIKTLYKLQSVMDDLGALSVIDISEGAVASANMTDVLSDITPFLSDSRKATVSNIADNIKKAKKTVEQIGSAKTRISSLPEDTPRTERIKAIINEIPAISGIPILDNLNNIKSLLSLIKPETATEATSENDKSETAGNDYDDIFELVGLLDDKQS